MQKTDVFDQTDSPLPEGITSGLTSVAPASLLLSTLQPTSQPELARRLLDISYRRRQRQRDCFAGLAGLLTGIAATLLVMVCLFGAQVQRNFTPTVYNVPSPQRGEGRESGRIDQRMQSPFPEGEGTYLRRAYTQPLDIDEWIARYEKLLRHRPAVVYKPVVYMPAALPEGVSPLEYRNRLLEDFDG